MSSFNRFLQVLLVATGLFSSARAGELTLDISEGGAKQLPPTPLVNLGDTWHYRFGTNAPQVAWKTLDDASLDATWQTGPAGFGYEDGDDATLLTSVMSNRFTTLYIRKTFTVPSGVDTNQRIQVVVDYDDAFIAWLDGVEIARASNAPGAVGTEPAFNAVSLAPNHEARGYQGLPLEVFDGGVVGSRLAPGTHVLSVLGLNSGATSSDFTLNPSLRVTGSTNTGSTLVDGFFRLVTTNVVVLSGSNTIAGATRVVVNGDDANYSIADGTWSKVQSLSPGMNKVYVATLDATGNVLASVTKDVVYQQTSTAVGGTLTTNTVWTSDMGIIRLTSDVIVPTGRTLSISNGAIVLLSQTNSIKAQTGAVDVAGTTLNPVYFLPADGTNSWREISATGTNATLTMRYAHVVAGQTRSLNGGVVLVEDSRLRDLHDGGREIVAGVNGGGVTLRRSYVARFTEVDARETPVLIEDCLLEQFLVDGVDIKGTNVPLVIRRSTLRFGDPNNSNADALDFGPGPGTVEGCLVHHFPDKGVSIGGASGSTVTGSVIYNCGIGISAYSSSNIFFQNTTIVGCTNGILARNNPTPALGAATNMIVWGNTNNVVITNTAVIQFSYSDTQGTNFPGPGNISADPLFVNAAAADFRLAAGSPAAGTGLDGLDMGALFPVGGIPSEPANVAAILLSGNQVRLQWQDTADNETNFVVQSSTDATTWQQVTTLGMNTSSTTLSGLSPGRLYFRVKTVNSAGESPWSNLAAVQVPGPAVAETIVGGTLAENTTWSTNLGTILVRTTVIVPSNIVLTVQEGTVIKMTNGTSIRATSGGIINILGTENNKIRFSHVIQSNLWGELSATGTNASITVRHADVFGGQTTVYNGASGLMEDSFFHDYRLLSGGTIFTSPILLSHFAKSMVVRRCHFREYHETLLRNGLILVEDCLFEEVHGDALDFDGAWPGTAIRRSTFRNGFTGNVDAVDVGNDGNNYSIGVIVEDCIMHDFPFDKGVSIGDGSINITVRNCLVYGCDSGVAVKDECTANIYNCTLVDNTYGINLKAKYPAQYLGGRATNTYNNIIWGNDLSIWETNSSIISVKYSDVEGTNFPGVGNISLDPLFLNAAQRDYRLTSNSPCLTTGQGGSRMGVTFPVGGLPDVPANLHATSLTGSPTEAVVGLTWQETSSAESGFVIEASTNGVLWTAVTTAPVNSISAIVSGLVPGEVYAFRIRATNFIGGSFNSDLASPVGTSTDLDGDGLPNQYEADYSLNAFDPSDAAADADSDGATNLQEYLAGTDPRNASSRLAFTSIQRPTATQVTLTFHALANRTYTIQYLDSLTTGSWQTLANIPSGTDRDVTTSDTLPTIEATRFYRIVTP